MSLQKTGKQIALTESEAWMIIGSEFKNAWPFSDDVLNEETKDWDSDKWADFAAIAVEQKVWDFEILKTIVEYSVSNVPMTINFERDMQLAVFGGVDGKTEKGRKLIEEIASKIKDGKMKYAGPDGKPIKRTKRKGFGKKFF